MILFVSLFALDSFSAERTFWQNAAAFLIHLIPSFVLLAVLIIAWKWEKSGGIILTIAGLAWSIFVFQLNLRRTHSIAASLMIILMLCIPFVLAGILFIISDSRKKKEISSIN
jgi:prolipoprotein diacylglyceryltransferase